jgi:hypothetical protein
LTSLISARPEILKGSIDYYDGFTKSGLRGSTASAVDCLNNAVFDFEFKFAELQTKVFDCISDDNSHSHSESHSHSHSHSHSSE